MKTYVKYPPRKLQSKTYTGPITLSEYREVPAHPGAAREGGLQPSDADGQLASGWRPWVAPRAASVRLIDHVSDQFRGCCGTRSLGWIAIDMKRIGSACSGSTKKLFKENESSMGKAPLKRRHQPPVRRVNTKWAWAILTVLVVIWRFRLGPRRSPASRAGAHDVGLFPTHRGQHRPAARPGTRRHGHGSPAANSPWGRRIRRGWTTSACRRPRTPGRSIASMSMASGWTRPRSRTNSSPHS